MAVFNRSSPTGLVASFLLSACLVGCGGDPTAADPDLILEDGFVSGRSRVEILAEGGTITRGLDAWLKLLPGGDLRLRHEDEYRFVSCTEPVEWFNQVLPQAELDATATGLVCRAYSNTVFDYPNGRWFVEDRGVGVVYYRVWKHY